VSCFRGKTVEGLLFVFTSNLGTYRLRLAKLTIQRELGSKVDINVALLLLMGHEMKENC
jgi:hypothetical protein